MSPAPLPPEFYRAPTLEVAAKLLGKRLVRNHLGQTLQGRIVEVEAYHQEGDAASHSFRGRTNRNAVMFGPLGHLYVYISYGVHCCMNVVTEDLGIGAAVLIRAIQPLEGLSTIRQLRQKARNDRDLANGPGKACQAFGIGMAENGAPLQAQPLYLAEGDLDPGERIASSTRIGITKATQLPWRFYLDGNAFVSKGKPSGEARLGKAGGP